MKLKLNLSLVIGLSALFGGLVLAQHIAVAIYEALPAVEAPSTQTDNLVFALPFYIAKVLFQAAGPLLLVLIVQGRRAVIRRELQPCASGGHTASVF